MSANVYTCPRLSSGDKDVVSLVDGFAYWGGPTPGIEKRWDFAILNTGFNALAWRFDINLNGAFITGVAGPGWGTGTFNNELVVGNGSDTRLSLGTGAPYTEAGFLFGAMLKFAFRIRVSGWVGVRWVGGWRGHFENVWGTISDNSFQGDIDVLMCIIKAIQFAVKKFGSSPLQAVLDNLKPATPVGRANWSLTHKTTGALAAITEAPTDLLPQLALRLDIAPWSPWVQAFNRSMSSVGSEIQYGPTLGIGFPIHIQVLAVVCDDIDFEVTGTHEAQAKTYYDTDRGHRISGTLPTGFGTPGYRPDSAGLRYKWSWGLDFTVGCYASINIFWVLGLTLQYWWPLLSLLGADMTVQSDVRGGLTNSFQYERLLGHDDGSGVEVVFEEPLARA